MLTSEINASCVSRSNLKCVHNLLFHYGGVKLEDSQRSAHDKDLIP